jgi:hypothetical protein
LANVVDSLHPRFNGLAARGTGFGRYAAPLIASGATLFSGSIYGLILSSDGVKKVLGPVTPLGGKLIHSYHAWWMGCNAFLMCWIEQAWVAVCGVWTASYMLAWIVFVSETKRRCRIEIAALICIVQY